jgi:hypothetical protein
MIVYTAISGGRDELKVQPKGVDYIAYTESGRGCNGWTGKLLANDNNPVRRAKAVRVLCPFEDITMWVDASIQLLSLDTDSLVKTYLKNSDIAALKHPVHKGVYRELKAVLSLGKEPEPEKAKNQVSRYAREGLPGAHPTAHYGAFAGGPGHPRPIGHYQTGILLRRRTAQIKALERVWWEEIVNGSERCQLSFPYALWKTGVKCTPIEDYSWFRICPHARGPGTGKALS